MKILKFLLILLLSFRISKSIDWKNSNLKLGVTKNCKKNHINSITYKNLSLLNNDIFIYKSIFLNWTKILPEVFTSKLNLTEIKKYTEKLDKLLQVDVEPIVIISSDFLPRNFDYIGGWTNPIVVEYFSNYARQVFKIFGSRVRKWCTFYNPIKICEKYKGLGNAEFLCGHNILIAHAEAYHIYDKEFRVTQNGEIAINLEIPYDEKNLETLQFQLGYYANPLLNFDYPVSLVNKIYSQSTARGFGKSLLPEFSYFEKNKITGTLDHLQLTYRTKKLGKLLNNTRTEISKFKQILEWITKTYHNPRLILMEVNANILQTICL